MPCRKVVGSPLPKNNGINAAGLMGADEIQ
jgi:hypothetical protein